MDVESWEDYLLLDMLENNHLIHIVQFWFLPQNNIFVYVKNRVGG